MQSKFSFREYWADYGSEVLFGFVLVVLVGLSSFLAQYIPDDIYDHVLTPAFNVGTFTVAFAGAWVLFRHAQGQLARKLFGIALLAWAIGDAFYLAGYFIAPMHVMNMGAEQLTMYELLLGNLLGWLMTLYPTETLRPGWLTWKIVLWQLVPLFGLVALDYMIPIDLWPIVALYPYILLIIVLSHIHAYRVWCENNFSSMEDIDVQWIIRYCIMLFIIGANYVYMLTGHGHTRAFTQQWFVIFMLVYSTEQILFRQDPWRDLIVDSIASGEEQVELKEADYAQLLEQWMVAEKPYLQPEFKLMDVRSVLPLNRTYLSQFINDTYGCSFYQFVNRYRIEEAKRMMQEHPEMKISEIAAHSGFSSQSSFSRAFARETGMTPSAWGKNV